MKTLFTFVLLLPLLQGCSIRTINYYNCSEHDIEKKTILNTQLNDSLAGKQTIK